MPLKIPKILVLIFGGCPATTQLNHSISFIFPTFIPPRTRIWMKWCYKKAMWCWKFISYYHKRNLSNCLTLKKKNFIEKIQTLVFQLVIFEISNLTSPNLAFPFQSRSIQTMLTATKIIHCHLLDYSCIFVSFLNKVPFY